MEYTTIVRGDLLDHKKTHQEVLTLQPPQPLQHEHEHEPEDRTSYDTDVEVEEEENVIEKRDEGICELSFDELRAIHARPQRPQSHDLILIT